MPSVLSNLKIAPTYMVTLAPATNFDHFWHTAGQLKGLTPHTLSQTSSWLRCSGLLGFPRMGNTLVLLARLVVTSTTTAHQLVPLLSHPSMVFVAMPP